MSFVSAAQHRVICPTETIQAEEDDDVTLRFDLDPRVNLSDYTLDVRRTDLEEVVHAYRHGKDLTDPQTERYRHRTTLIHEDLSRGIITLQISSVQLKDSGPYRCFVPELRAGCTTALNVGDDNGCNLGAALLGSPPKQSRPTLASPRKLGFDENSPVTARRQLVPSSPRQPLSPAVALSPRRQETPAGSPARQNSEKKPPVVRLFAEKSRFQSVKQALHTAVPERLLSREAERASIRSFLEDKVLRRVPGSLYISGAPGTGKTACFNCVLQEMK
ncbi:cell division control protein 6 homolog, partial [Seriola lalandi dorsalis]|uniref:cell division control protein 6 homolog n=1 Tax=Seriola lalandi dorsalis TaxID=1841481 RepID=UPI000C6F9586